MASSRLQLHGVATHWHFLNDPAADYVRRHLVLASRTFMISDPPCTATVLVRTLHVPHVICLRSA